MKYLFFKNTDEMMSEIWCNMEGEMGTFIDEIRLIKGW